MIVEILKDGIPLDLYQETNIKHTLQVNDVAEVKDRQSSFTDSFSIPKTAKNVLLLKGLGLPSNTSLIPYQKPNALVKIEGLDFLVNAWLNVKETDDEYKIYIYSGIIEFFKKLENGTIGGSLKDLITEIDHNKNLTTVAASQTNDALKYAYLFADFNGRTHRKADATVLNIDYIVPSVLVSYLFAKIHLFAGYTFTGSFVGTEDYENWFISYPKAPEDVNSIDYFSETSDIYFSQIDYTGSFLFTNQGAGTDGVKIGHSGYYNFQISSSAGLNLPIPSGYGQLSYVIYYTLNGVTHPLQQNTVFEIFLHENDILVFYFEVNTDWSGTIGMSLSIKKLEDVSFSEELEDLKITDFLKDVYNLLGLTPMIDNVNKVINYKTNQERYKTAEVEDWSDYLVEIEKESYSFGTYAKQNYFRYKYNDQEESQSDGYFKIDNENLDDSKTIFSSYTYSIEKDQNDYYLNATNTEKVQVFKLYEKEAQDGSTEVKYKPLSKRYFYLRMRKVNMNVSIGSDIQNTNVPLSVFKLGEFSRLNMDYFISKYYSSFKSVVEYPVIWNSKLSIPYPKLLQLDLSKAYYFKQLQQYCIINKMSFDENEASAELVRIKDFRVL